MLWFWSVISYAGTVQQTVGGLTGNATYRLVAWCGSSGRNIQVGVGVGIHGFSAVIIDETDVTRVSLDFTIPAGETILTITISSPAGTPSSWAWIDAVELYLVPP
jgi:hypothetical protein